jgi:purine-binding chemotaxis protein CheW
MGTATQGPTPGGPIPSREPGASTQHPQYLTFLVGEEEYAVGVLRVREIIQYHAVTRVPRTPEWIRGVINLRGSVVPVVDLAVKFGLPATVPGRCTCIVLVEARVEGEPVVMGMIADEVRQVVDLPNDAVQPPPAFGTRVSVDYLEAMGRVDSRMVLLLNVDRLLAAEQIVAASAVEGELAAATSAESSALVPVQG